MRLTSAQATKETSGNRRKRSTQSHTFSTESLSLPSPAKRAKCSQGSTRVAKSSRASSKIIDDGIFASNPRLGFFPLVASLSVDVVSPSPSTRPSYKKING